MNCAFIIFSVFISIVPRVQMLHLSGMKHRASFLTAWKLKAARCLRKKFRLCLNLTSYSIAAAIYVQLNCVWTLALVISQIIQRNSSHPNLSLKFYLLSILLQDGNKGSPVTLQYNLLTKFMLLLRTRYYFTTDWDGNNLTVGWNSGWFSPNPTPL